MWFWFDNLTWRIIISPMTRSHKIRLVPNQDQVTALKRAVGTARFVYNWGLEAWNKQYEAYTKGETTEKPTAYSISRKWTMEKPEWAKEVNRDCQTRAFLNLGIAWIGFWNKRTGKPAFKKKQDRGTFYVGNSKAYIEGAHVHLPKIGCVRLREELRYQGKVIGYTVSHQAGQWYVSVKVEFPAPASPMNPSLVGVDVGISAIAVASDGSICPNPKLLWNKQKCLKRMQRKLTRQVKGSHRRAKTKLCLAKAHLKISNTRNDAIHKFTSRLAKNHGTAVIETLDIQGMVEQAHKGLRRLFQDTAMQEVHRQLGYKMGSVVKAPPYFPSSKRCSSCGHVKAVLPCDVRVYVCERCGHAQDRDANAAQNLRLCPWVTGAKPVEPPKRALKRETMATLPG